MITQEYIPTEEVAGVLDRVAGESPHVTEVKLWAATGQLAQRGFHRIAVIKIVVKPGKATNELVKLMTLKKKE